MRLHVKLLGLICLAALFAGAGVILAQGRLADFGLNEAGVKQGVIRSLIDGTLQTYPDRRMYKAATPAARTALVKNALSLVKAYCESPAFKVDYDKQREAARPQPPKPQGTVPEQLAKNFADQRAAVENMKKNMAKMTPEMQKQMAPTIRQMEDNITRMEKDPRTTAMLRQGLEQTLASEQKTYQERLVVFEKRFPADPRPLIAGRLHQFLDETRDFPFEAKLVPGKGGKFRFADSQLEAKPFQWKLCYRAGREPVEAARTFAMEWLRQIEGK
ncbi:MAG: hypothetical protein HY892_05765 [Deltaproteobacteria bacterium]|nr:hypothetical protein [Deltaproteobacteria bacterium]